MYIFIFVDLLSLISNLESKQIFKGQEGGGEKGLMWLHAAHRDCRLFLLAVAQRPPTLRLAATHIKVIEYSLFSVCPSSNIFCREGRIKRPDQA